MTHPQKMSHQIISQFSEINKLLSEIFYFGTKDSLVKWGASSRWSIHLTLKIPSCQPNEHAFFENIEHERTKTDFSCTIENTINRLQYKIFLSNPKPNVSLR